MIKSEYGIAYKEVLEILKCIPIEDYNKIPKDKIELFETNANKDYIFNYDPNKTLNEQNVSKIAKGIIAILFRDYWATETQRQKIINIQNYERRKLEEEKLKKYNPDNLFKNSSTENTSETIKEKALIETKKEKFYDKLLKFLIDFYHN